MVACAHNGVVFGAGQHTSGWVCPISNLPCTTAAHGWQPHLPGFNWSGMPHTARAHDASLQFGVLVVVA